MRPTQSPLRLLFLLLSGLLIAVFLIFSWQSWREARQRHANELNYINRLLVSTTGEIFAHYESVLSILGERLLTVGADVDPERGRALIDQMLRINPAIVAFGLARSDGQLLLVSGVRPGVSLPSLRATPEGAESFRRVLSAKGMQTGRTYYMPLLKRWVIPMRVPILGPDGKVSLVMTAGISVEPGDTTWGALDLPAQVDVRIIRSDGYLQFVAPLDQARRHQVYDHPVAPTLFAMLAARHTAQTIADETSALDGVSRLVSVAHLPTYELYTVVSQPTAVLARDWLERMAGPAALFAFFMIGGVAFYRMVSSMQLSLETQRGAAEERLRVSEQRFRELADLLPEMIYETDDHGVATYLNAQASVLTGYSAAELEESGDLGQPVSKLLAPEHQGHAQMRFAALMTGHQVGIAEYYMRRKDGSRVPVLARAVPIVRDGQRVGVRGVFFDISDVKAVEERLRKLSHAVEQSPSMVMIVDGHGRIEYVNPRFTELTGYRPDEVIGALPAFLREDAQASRVQRELRAALEAGREWRGEVSAYRKNGELWWQQLAISPLRDAQGEITHFVAVGEDISVRKHQEQELLRQAHYDGVTGMPNRMLALDRLSQAIQLAKREGWLVAVLFVDLDHFKRVNDTFGHLVGDELLKQYGARLQACVRTADTVARLGGDEFLIILSDLDDAQQAERVAENILESGTEPVLLNNQEIFSTASIGIAVYPRDGDSAHQLLKNADTAMYRAKEGGRNTFRYFSREMNEQAVRHLSVETKLRQALERDEFQLHYQPQVELSSGRMIGVEALLRWSNQDLGCVLPSEFVPVAEDTGLVVALGEYVLERACEDLLWLQAQQHTALRLAVNVSPRQLRRGHLLQIVRAVLDRTHFPAPALELEITENILVEKDEEAVQALQALRDWGVGISVDDFGTGYSSLNYLSRMPITGLKIDRSFIRDIPVNTNHVALTRTLIAMGQAMGLRLTAEGVETAEQLAYLRDNGCLYAQGFYFCAPLPLDQLTRKLAHWPADGRSLA